MIRSLRSYCIIQYVSKTWPITRKDGLLSSSIIFGSLSSPKSVFSNRLACLKTPSGDSVFPEDSGIGPGTVPAPLKSRIRLSTKRKSSVSIREGPAGDAGSGSVKWISNEVFPEFPYSEGGSMTNLALSKGSGWGSLWSLLFASSASSLFLFLSCACVSRISAGISSAEWSTLWTLSSIKW